MENLVSLYIESIIYASFMDSKFAENSSRKNAMTQANKNIDDIVNTLHIQYNKRRQERITSELQNNG
jgi:F-type H+-transporting ATPase subunit gamma